MYLGTDSRIPVLHKLYSLTRLHARVLRSRRFSKYINMYITNVLGNATCVKAALCPIAGAKLEFIVDETISVCYQCIIILKYRGKHERTNSSTSDTDRYAY
jgi:hypothetical protein